MQVIATGRWSKSDKQWKMVVAMRKGGSSDKAIASQRGIRRHPAPKTD